MSILNELKINKLMTFVTLSIAMISFGIIEPAYAEYVEVPALTESGEEQQAIADIVRAATGSDQGGVAGALRALVPIVGTILAFGMPIFIIGMVLMFKHKRRKLMHKSLSLMIEKGVEIPPHFFTEGMLDDQGAKRPALHKGLISIAIGLGIIGFAYSISVKVIAGIGLVPLFIGFAYLLIWKLEEKDSDK